MNEDQDAINQPPQEELSIDQVIKEQEALDYKNKYLQALADNENTLKRLKREKEEAIRHATENALSDFLIPLDNLENALGFAENMSDEVKNWALGFKMILAQFKEALQEQGIEAFSSVGSRFDPSLHEAVETEETDSVQEGTVTQEFVRGYKCKGRILRPARVKVAKKVTQKEE